MTILTVGIDLAKNVFAVHGVNEAGKAELVRPAVPRDKLHELIASLPPCVIGMEACSGAHHWARLFQAAGHTVRLIAPKFVTPYRMTGKRGKNDAADAAAICEAIQRHGGQTQVGQHQPMGGGLGRAARLLAGSRGHRSQERAHGLGGAATRRGVCTAGVAAPTSPTIETQENTEPPPCDGKR
jgi:transposase